MKNLLNSFLGFLESLPDILVYMLLALSAFVENVFPPVPGDTITAFGAFLAGAGRLGFPGVYFSTTLGSLAGFMCLFWIGRRLGRRYFIEKDYRFFRARDIRRAEVWFRKYGYFLVFINRFLPGLRSAISLAGGISQLKTAQVALLSLASCAIWNLIWISVGYTLGRNWETAQERLSAIIAKYNAAVVALLVLVILLLVVRKWFFARNGSR
jgi:membrane protein DedA with SNARE-associated domain